MLEPGGQRMVVAQKRAACRCPEFVCLFFSRCAACGNAHDIIIIIARLEIDPPRLPSPIAIGWIEAPSAVVLALVLTIFGYGQGLVMAPLSSALLSTVKPASAGAASGIYGTTAQVANAAGVAAIGAVFFAIESSQSSRLALLAALALSTLSTIACAAFLTWMRRVTG
jgi:hypothetical protein